MAIDRISGKLTIARPGQDVQVLETITSPLFDNRFSSYVFPAIRAQGSSDHPDLRDGWRVQLFTDAAVLSARRGGWVELNELDQEHQPSNK